MENRLRLPFKKRQFTSDHEKTFPLKKRRYAINLGNPGNSNVLDSNPNVLDCNPNVLESEKRRKLNAERCRAYRQRKNHKLKKLTAIAREFNEENVLTEECSPIIVGPSVSSVQDNDFLAEPHQSAKNLDLDSITRSSVVRRIGNVMSHSEFCSSYRQLNFKQLTFLLEYINRLSFTPYEQNHRPLQVFFTGPAGTGKSFVLKLLMETANRFSLRHNTSKCAFVACATTGKAAVNIDGTTVHTAFNISINAKKNLHLREDLLHSMRCDFNEVTTVIVDEVSMMSYDILKQIDSRLRAVSRDANANFGGYHVIFCGDLRQLPPVNAKPVFARPPNLLQTRMLWHSLDFFSLEEVVRQKDIMFSTILTKVGNGDVLNERERAILEKRFIPNENLGILDNLKNAVFLFHRNRDVDDYNFKVLNVDGNVCCLAEDIISGYKNDYQLQSTIQKIKKMDVTQTGNMPTKLLLVTDTPYIITQNIDKMDKIVNGSFGYLRHIEYNSEDLAKVQRLWIEFDDARMGSLLRTKYQHHSHALGFPHTWTPIIRREAVISVGSKLIKVRRKQFPLVAANAMTIHKSQGGTYDTVVYEYSKSHEVSLVYVALSRAKTLDRLYLTNHKGDYKFYHSHKSTDREVLRTEFIRLGKRQLDCIMERCLYKVNNIPDTTSIAYLNVQSLNAHAIDVTTDIVFKKCKILCLSETWMDDSEEAKIIDGFRCVTRYKRKHVKAGGVAIYESLTSNFKHCNVAAALSTTPSCGDVCSVQITYHNTQTGQDEQFTIVTVYCQVGISATDLMTFIDNAMWPFSSQAYPLILCGDFNYNFRTTTGSILMNNFLTIHGLQLASDNITITTRSGNCIDFIFYRNSQTFPTIETIPYISYFSVHRPLLILLHDKKILQSSAE